MRLLLDTHIALWAAVSPKRLTISERACLETAEAPLVLSTVSIWELRLKWQRFHVSGERKGPLEPAAIVTFAAAMEWRILPLMAGHAVATLSEPLMHADPFDDLLLAQAQVEGLRLLTRDAKLLPHSLSAGR